MIAPPRRSIATGCAAFVLAVAALTGVACGDDDGARPDAAVPDGSVDGATPEDGGVGGDHRATVIRDSYGVPHVFADDVRGASYALGFVEAEDNRDLMLARLWGSVGRLSGKTGVSCGMPCLERDVRVHADRVVESVERGYPSLREETREVLEAYAAGMNAFFAQATPRAALWDASDPVTAQMIVAAQLEGRIQHARDSTQADLSPETGSNQLVVTGSRTVGGATIVIKDPHNLWTGNEAYAHVHVGDHDAVGNWFGGMLGCGTNGFVSFGCTRSSPVPVVSVRLRMRYGARVESTEPCGPYTEAFYADHAAGGDGFAPFEMRCLSVAREGDAPVTGWAYESRFGTLEHAGDDTDGDGLPDEAFVSHVFASHDIGFIDALVERTYVESAEDFLAIYAAPTPIEDAQYRAFGARDGVIGFVLGASVPGLDPAVDWHHPVSSEDARIDGWNPNGDWSVLDSVAFYNVDGTPPELPHVLRPDGDLVENCNGNPEWATEPMGQVGEVPRVLEVFGGPSGRDERMRELVLSASDPLDVDDVRAIATDIVVTPGRRLAEALACGLAASGVDPEETWGDGGRLLRLLLDWSATGYEATVDSEAMTLMYLIDATRLVAAYPPEGECASVEAVEAVAIALRDSIAPAMRRVYGPDFADPLRVPWGHLNRVVIGGVERGLPGAGGNLATLFVNAFELDGTTGRGNPEVHLGSRATQVTSLSPEGHEVWITSPHGQIDERLAPDSPHVGQTIDDYAARRFRRVLLTRDEVELDACPYGDPLSASFDPAHEHATRWELSAP